jgi:hypothetical protein
MKMGELFFMVASNITEVRQQAVLKEQEICLKLTRQSLV